MKAPLLTVILPVHNGMPFLRAAVESILAQTFADFKVLAIDDGSTDGSGAYLDAVRDERVTVLHQACSGLGAVLNRGISLCETPFLARMDADDISLPTRFEEQIDFLIQHPDVVAVGSPLEFLVHATHQRGLVYPVEHEEIVGDLMRGQSSLSHPTLLMRTSVARATGYRIQGAGEDLDFCLRLAECGKVANLKKALYQYRLHEASVSMKKHEEIERGYSFARLTATQRRDGLPETSFEEFSNAWRSRGVLSKIRTRLVSVSFGRYRLARLAWARQAYLQSVTHLMMSLALQPLTAVRRVVRGMGSRLWNGT